MPISTTHAAASSIVGAGVGSGKGANWKVVGEMVLAWIITIPAAATVAFLMFKLTQLPTVAAWIAVGAVIVAVRRSWAVWAMLHTIHAEDVEAEIPAEEELAEPLPGAPAPRGPRPGRVVRAARFTRCSRPGGPPLGVV